MTKPNASLQENYFKEVYHNSEDPWNFETSLYEKNKYKATVEALTKQSYKQAFEIGCSIGVLSELLAVRCKNLLSVDIADAPLARAKQRLQKYPHVTLQKMTVPNEFPLKSFDLIIMSEVGYYLAMPELMRLRDLIVQHLEPEGQLLLVHWTPDVPDYPLTGDEVHEVFLSLCGDDQPFVQLNSRRETNYRLDILQKV